MKSESSLVKRMVWRLVICAMAIVLLPSHSGAQDPATSFHDLQFLLFPGEEAIVTHADGRQTRVRIRGVSDSSLEVQPKSVFRRRLVGPRTNYQESQVTKVTRVDSNKTGLYIGLGIGAGFGLIAVCPPEECYLWFIGSGLIFGLAGAGVGALLDSAIRKTVYRAGTPNSGRATLTLSPVLSTEMAGASVRLRF